VVGEVEDLFGRLVVWPPVCAISICVVLPPVLYAVVEDVGCERVGLIAHETAAVEAGIRRKVVDLLIVFW
jgi:hypothetical protein